MFSSKHLFMSSGGVIASVLFVFALLVLPAYREARAVDRQIAELRTKVAGLQDQTQAVERLADEVVKVKRRLDRDLKIIPDSPDIAGLIRKLSQDVDHVAVLDQTFTAGSAGDAATGGGTTTQAMPLTVDMEASFESVFALLRNAESMSRLVRVASVHVLCKRDEKKPQNAAMPIVQASVGLEAVYEPAATEEH
jgi:hypothetical protein